MKSLQNNTTFANTNTHSTIMINILAENWKNKW